MFFLSIFFCFFYENLQEIDGGVEVEIIEEEEVKLVVFIWDVDFIFKMNFEKSLFYILCDYNVNFMQFNLMLYGVFLVSGNFLLGSGV